MKNVAKLKAAKLKAAKLTAAVAATALAATTITACTPPGQSGGSDEVIKIATTDGDRSAWGVFEEKAKEEGIKLEVQNFGDYNTPNKALSEGVVDVNLFQHLKFLAEYNVGAKDNLTPVGSTEINPLALYWKDHTSLDGIEGENVSIPNDSSNQGRAINVLVQAGLVKLKEEGLVSPTPADIDEAASKVKVVPVDAAQTTTTFGEGKPAVINNSFLERAGIDPNLSIFKDDPNSSEAEPYINVFVTKPEKADDEKIAKLVEIWQSKEVTDAVAKDSNGTSVPVKRDKAELQQILKRLEEAKK